MSDRKIVAEKAWETRRKKARKLSKAAKKAWETRWNKFKDLRQSIRLIECISEKETKCSEVKMLDQLFSILNYQMSDNKESVEHTPSLAKDARDLINILLKARESCIHISCHGKYYKNYKKTALQFPEANLFSDQIRLPDQDEELRIWEDRISNDKPIPQLIFLSACETGYATDLCERFMQAGARFVIGPKEETKFSDAALFASAFYPLVFVERKDPKEAFDRVKKAFPKLSGKWKFYDTYTHNFEYYDPDGTGRL
jgi:hypothetical protein